MKTKKVAHAKKVAPKKTVNKLFPGLPNYTGPQRGYFAFVHHAQLFEHTSEDIKNRIEYVKDRKPTNEQGIRLRHILLLGPSLSRRIAAINKQNAPVYGCYNNQAKHDQTIRAAVLRYARRHIKPLRWNGASLTLVSGREMTG